MLAYISGALRITLCAVAFLLSSFTWVLLALPLAPIALLLPFKRVHEKLFDIVEYLSLGWLACQAWTVRYLLPTTLDVSPISGLSTHGRYIILSNHQSFADPFVLMATFHRKIPFARYFAKFQTLFIPLVNIGAYTMRFPMLRRYPAEVLKKKPHLRLKDVHSIQRLCKHFKNRAFSLVSFTEGTRFTLKKYKAQQSPYRHLLKPKAGGLAVFLNNFSEPIDGILDVSIIYERSANFMQFIAGKVPKVTVKVRKIKIPESLKQGNYTDDPSYRQAFKAWIEKVWQEKDRLIDETLAQSQAS